MRKEWLGGLFKVLVSVAVCVGRAVASVVQLQAKRAQPLRHCGCSRLANGLQGRHCCNAARQVALFLHALWLGMDRVGVRVFANE